MAFLYYSKSMLYPDVVTISMTVMARLEDH